MSSSGNTHPWIAFRKQMPVAERYAYLDHAAVSPLPASAQAAIKSWCDDTTLHGDVHWPTWAAKVEQTRASAAKLLGAGVDEIALVRSTTEGITLVAEGYPWREGDNLVTLADEFPSNLYPWMNLASRGVETRRVSARDGRLDLAALEAACDAHTRIISVSWVGYV